MEIATKSPRASLTGQISCDSAVGAKKLGVMDDRALSIESQIPYSPLASLLLVFKRSSLTQSLRVNYILYIRPDCTLFASRCHFLFIVSYHLSPAVYPANRQYADVRPLRDSLQGCILPGNDLNELLRC